MPIFMPQTDAGNTLATARSGFAVDQTTRVFRDRIGGPDPNDFYQFTLSGRSSVGIVLESNGGNLQLLNGTGTALETLNAPGTFEDYTSRVLDAGTYFVRVSPEDSSQEVNYRLGIGAGSAADLAGNTQATACNLGALSSTAVTFSDQVGIADRNDFYRFSLSATSDISLSAPGLGTDFGALLYREGVANYLGLNILGAGNSLPTRLEAGTYYLQIVPGQTGLSDTIDYTLSLSATLVPSATIRVSVDSNSVQGNNSSFYPSISEDGRFVAFVSRASNLVSGDTNGTNDVFVRDTLNDTTRRVSFTPNGTQVDGAGAGQPSISPDGRFVAFTANFELFVRDTVANTTRQIYLPGSIGRGEYGNPTISRNGRFVAFSYAPEGWVLNYSSQKSNIFVYDTVADTARQVSLNSSGAQSNGDSRFPYISADGYFVAFTSYASNLVNDDTNGKLDVFVRNTLTNTTRRVSLNLDGSQRNAESGLPSISGDGRHVAFVSSHSIWGGGTNTVFDVFMGDTVTNTTRQISLSSQNYQGNEDSYSPSISADGRYVAFYSDASNLVGDDTNGVADAFVRDTVTNTTRRILLDSSFVGDPKVKFYSSPAISADGRYVAIASKASNLVSGDTNGAADVFVVGPLPVTASSPALRVGGTLPVPVQSSPTPKKGAVGLAGALAGVRNAVASRGSIASSTPVAKGVGFLRGLLTNFQPLSSNPFSLLALPNPTPTKRPGLLGGLTSPPVISQPTPLPKRLKQIIKGR